MAHKGQRALPLDLVFELAHQIFMDGRTVGQRFRPKVFGVHIPQRTIRQLIGDFGAQLHLKKLQHGQKQVAQIHIKLV